MQLLEILFRPVIVVAGCRTLQYAPIEMIGGTALVGAWKPPGPMDITTG
jgi:hypothetical protein